MNLKSLKWHCLTLRAGPLQLDVPFVYSQSLADNHYIQNTFVISLRRGLRWLSYWPCLSVFYPRWNASISALAWPSRLTYHPTFHILQISRLNCRIGNNCLVAQPSHFTSPLSFRRNRLIHKDRKRIPRSLLLHLISTLSFLNLSFSEYVCCSCLRWFFFWHDLLIHRLWLLGRA